MKHYSVIIFSLLCITSTLAMVRTPGTRTFYQPTTTRVWEGMEEPQSATTTSSYGFTSGPRYLGTPTAPRTLFTRPTAEQPALQRAAFARWQQQTPRTLLQQPTTSTRAFETQKPFVQPTARTFATSPTRQSWWNWLSSWWKKTPESSEAEKEQERREIDDADFKIMQLSNTLQRIDNTLNPEYPKEYKESFDKLIMELSQRIDQFPSKYINKVSVAWGLTDKQGKYHLDNYPDAHYLDPIFSNRTALKEAIYYTRNMSNHEQYTIIERLLEKGAYSNHNPHYTTSEALAYLTTGKAHRESLMSQYPPIWIAIMQSNVGALQALLQAGAKITNETAEQVSNMSFTKEAKLNLLEIAKNINNEQILNILEKAGYTIPPAKPYQETQPKIKKEEPTAKPFTPFQEFKNYTPAQMLTYMQIKGSAGDYAAALGLNANPSNEEIKSAVRAIMKTFHPDIVSVEGQKDAHEIADLTFDYRDKLLKPEPAIKIPPGAEEFYKDLFKDLFKS